MFKFTPPATDFNTAPAVMPIMDSIRIGASRNHRTPYFIQRGFGHIVRAITNTSATFSSTRFEISGSNDARISTVTETFPISFYTSRFENATHSCVGSKPLTCQILEFTRSPFRRIMVISHLVYYSINKYLARHFELFKRFSVPFSIIPDSPLQEKLGRCPRAPIF